MRLSTDNRALIAVIGLLRVLHYSLSQRLSALLGPRLCIYRSTIAIHIIGMM
ncbi:hypothetical protein ACHQIQ_16765 [Klebsiella pneumoniae]|uniref:hypothetical protein n=1 Tax=Klebsiella pneumoniae TaxID=573 RepID=UPI003982CC8A|nr:hypothetical protein [Klebsiella pneumoniae]